jgi:hypothetical protein
MMKTMEFLFLRRSVVKQKNLANLMLKINMCCPVYVIESIMCSQVLHLKKIYLKNKVFKKIM